MKCGRIPTLAKVMQVRASRGAQSEAPELWKGLRLSMYGATLHGDDWLDASGEGNNGTLFGEPTKVLSPYGRALQLDGFDDAIIRDAPIPPVGDDLTFSVWFRHGTSGEERVVIHYGASFTTSGQWAVSLHNADVNFYDFPDGGAKQKNVLTYTSDLTSAANPFMLLTVTRRLSGLITGYINGRAFDCVAGQAGQCDDAAATKPMWIGVGSVGGGRFMGQMAGSCLWGRVLTPAEIKKLYADPHAHLRLRRRVYPVAALSAFGGKSYILGGGNSCILGA